MKLCVQRYFLLHKWQGSGWGTGPLVSCNFLQSIWGHTRKFIALIQCASKIFLLLTVRFTVQFNSQNPSHKIRKGLYSIGNSKQLLEKWKLLKFSIFMSYFTIFSALKNTKSRIITQNPTIKRFPVLKATENIEVPFVGWFPSVLKRQQIWLHFKYSSCKFLSYLNFLISWKCDYLYKCDFILWDVPRLSIESRIEVDRVSISLFKILSLILTFNGGLMQIEPRVTWNPKQARKESQGVLIGFSQPLSLWVHFTSDLTPWKKYRSEGSLEWETFLFTKRNRNWGLCYCHGNDSL